VLDHLTEEQKPDVAKKLNAAYALEDYAAAKQALNAPCQRFTFLQTCSTIENADSMTLVLAMVLRSCIGR
jgi:hypothetical protein